MGEKVLRKSIPLPSPHNILRLIDAQVKDITEKRWGQRGKNQEWSFVCLTAFFVLLAGGTKLRLGVATKIANRYAKLPRELEKVGVPRAVLRRIRGSLKELRLRDK